MLLTQFRALSMIDAALGFLLANILIFLSSILGCWAMGRLFPRQRLFDHWEPFSPLELGVAITAVLINTAVSVVGWLFWRADLIELRDKSVWLGVIDMALMVLAMDLGMYFLHRIAHQRWLFPLIHKFHHRHEVTNPISLFVLHPLEVSGFGALMIVFLLLYPISPLGLIGYLTLNVVFGTLGHSGVEPFPSVLQRIPLLNLMGTSTFHAEHHEHPRYNYGFYTLVWDRLFGTLDPEYWRRYAAAAIHLTKT